MINKNFDRLKRDWPDLYRYCSLAEQYIQDDPQSAFVKLRTFSEKLVDIIYNELCIPRETQSTFIDLLNNADFKNTIPQAVQSKLHLIRINGNKATHGNINTGDVLIILKEASDLACWFCPFINRCRYFMQKHEVLEAFDEMDPQESGMQSFIKAYARKDKQELKGSDKQKIIKEQGVKIADELDFDENETRKFLINDLLREAGWDVGNNLQNTNEVLQEEPVDHQPTDTGKGFIDYVLLNDDGKPLAVIEAKRTALSDEKGKTQAKLYADGLEKMGEKRPIIFYTNGIDISIWDDAQNYPPRRLFGFYSKDSLQYLLYQRNHHKDLNTLSAKTIITNRLYQIEAIKRVMESFSSQHRKALLVQATGTGKTRVAIAITEMLIRAGWVKRALFLCDRRELRQQAKNAYKEFLPEEPLTEVNSRTAQDHSQRIYLSTYPSMIKHFKNFDVGFFDLIISDESHRSIYNVYSDIFKYFDSLQIGLTATPVEFVNRNTYKLFDCKDQSPTHYYPLERAVEEAYLVPYEVEIFTTEFLRKGIKYDELSEKQRTEVEESGEDADSLFYEKHEIDKTIFNKDTERLIVRNLMENGIRSKNNQNVGKSIIFAHSHRHAVFLNKIFDELYPQYGGKFCQVIDSYDPRADELINNFKDPEDELTIAISVDMLDTGIDIPEIVNLVFAKPVCGSKVKFFQMIGRGTRLCKNLFGVGKDKKNFRIFDHCGNFDRYDYQYKAIESKPQKSLLQKIFEVRINLATTALEKAEPIFFKDTITLIVADIKALPEDSISVREKWKQKRHFEQSYILDKWEKITVSSLLSDIAPLMQSRNIYGDKDAYEFDLLISRMQLELLTESDKFEDSKLTLLDDYINILAMNLNLVREKAEQIRLVRSNNFWNDISVLKLESIRQELRTIMRYRKETIIEGVTRTVDITEDKNKIESFKRKESTLTMDMQQYENDVEKELKELFINNPILKKIRRLEPVTEKELEKLTSLILTQNPDLDLSLLSELYEPAPPLDSIIRSIVGIESEVVKQRFENFLQEHTSLNAKQIRFISLLQNHIEKYGAIRISRLYEEPFITIDENGIDGIFEENAANNLIKIVKSFSMGKNNLAYN